jgi:hypothetical protein
MMRSGGAPIVAAGAILATVAARVMSRTYTSYYTVAVSPEAQDPRAFLDRHAAYLAGHAELAAHLADSSHSRYLENLRTAFRRKEARMLEDGGGTVKQPHPEMALKRPHRSEIPSERDATPS